MPGRAARRVLAAAALALAIGWSAACGGGGGEPPPPEVALPSAAELRRIASRVERIRGLRFERLPRVEAVPVETIARRVREDLAREYPPAERRADELVLRLTGMLRPQDDFGALLDVGAVQPLGVYDPRRDRLTLVRRPANVDPATREITIAHELLHALEDQRFGLAEDPDSLEERDAALTALAEGSATIVHERYAVAHLDEAEVAAPAEPIPARGDQPPVVTAAIDIAYAHGPAFVQALLAEADGSWRLVDRAWRDRPPLTTEHVLHPQTYLDGDLPQPVSLERAGAVLRAAGWRRLRGEAMGQADAALLLRAGLGDGPGGLTDYARGWEGGRGELWRDAEGGPECDAPCTAHVALVIGLRWETPGEAAQFAADMRHAALSRLEGVTAGRDAWRSRGGALALSEGARATGIAFAPDPGLARRLAAEARPG
jgi:hypothetical protein